MEAEVMKKFKILSVMALLVVILSTVSSASADTDWYTYDGAACVSGYGPVDGTLQVKYDSYWQVTDWRITSGSYSGLNKSNVGSHPEVFAVIRWLNSQHTSTQTIWSK